MDKSARADALECRLLLSINVLPGDCVLLGCMTLWGPFGGPAELQWLQSLKVNFRHRSPFRNLKSAVYPSSRLLCMRRSPWSAEPFSTLVPWDTLSTFPRRPIKWVRNAWCSTCAHMGTFLKWPLKEGQANENNHSISAGGTWASHDARHFLHYDDYLHLFFKVLVFCKLQRKSKWTFAPWDGYEKAI